MVSWVDWVCAVLAMVDFMGWSMQHWSMRCRWLAQVDMARNDVAEIHVVSMQNENKKVRAHLVCLHSHCFYGPPPSTPHAPWYFWLVVLVFWCGVVFMLTMCDLITLTGKSCHTHQTHVMGAGWARVTKLQPIPAPAGTRGTNPHGFTNPWHSLSFSSIAMHRAARWHRVFI